MKTEATATSDDGSDGHDEEEEEQTMVVDEMLRRHVGEFGPWQLRHFGLTNLAWILNAFHTMVMVFADREPDWRCRAGPGCVPGSVEGVCGLEPGTWEWVGGSSTVAEWGLVCGEKYKVGLAQSAFFAGSMIGAGIFRHRSDSSLGRKGTLTAACIANGFFSLSTSLSPFYWAYATLRFLTGLATGCVGLTAFVLATELVGPSMRGAVGMTSFYFFSVGCVFLSGLAYAFPSWRNLYMVTSLPSLVFAFAILLPFIWESPRWTDKAMHTMRAIAKGNGFSIPNKTSLILDIPSLSPSSSTPSPSILDVARSPFTRPRLLLAVLINFLTSVVYYGLTLNVVNLGKSHLRLNVALNAVAKLPGYAAAALLLDRCGRCPVSAGTMWLGGVACTVGSLVTIVGTRMACGVVGIFAMATTYHLLMVYVAELFPTAVRNVSLRCVMQAGQLGGMAAPLVVVLGRGLPFAVFGACAVMVGAAALYLPEMADRPLYDTLLGMEWGESKLEGG
ncbi:Organic cation/carnitine transporter 4 [Acorus calamus]|uniref:H(+)/Pi cotransporter n=1 Tax=Acorus calamus TaxID=4465 RepID=A0AAV9E3I7_ACOCL|nr:Organic cation/carnitine transporter 4 [Acorus calamus]